MADAYFFWLVSIIISVSISFGLTLICIILLNPRFDSDWMGKRWTQYEASWQPFFPFIRALNYGGAVSSKWLANRLFREPDYDFRERVNTPIKWLCIIQQLAGFYFMISGVAYAFM